MCSIPNTLESKIFMNSNLIIFIYTIFPLNLGADIENCDYWVSTDWQYIVKTLANAISKRNWSSGKLFSLGSLTGFSCLEKKKKKLSKNFWQKFLTLILGHYHLELAYNKIAQKRAIFSAYLFSHDIFFKSSLRSFEVVEVKGHSSWF